MISGHLKHRTNLPIHLSCQRNIKKIKQVINCKYIHQLHVQENINTDNNTVINFPLINSHKHSNNENHFNNCVHKPLTINLQKSQTSNGDRKYLSKYPSVTTILSNTKTNSEFFSLMQWRKANIEKHGKEKFGLMQRKTTTKGTNFHLEMKTHFSNFNNLNTSNINNATSSGFFQSLANMLPGITNPLAIESAVVHSQLGYAGTVDLVAEYLGKISIIDWKTSQRKRTNLKDCHSYPLQLAAYAGAVNYDFDYPFQISNGVLVIAYENGDPADVHLLDEQLLEEYWDKWLLRLNEYRQKNLDENNLNIHTSDLTENSTNEIVSKGIRSDSVSILYNRTGTIRGIDNYQGTCSDEYFTPDENGSEEHYGDASLALNLKSTKGHDQNGVQSKSFGTSLNGVNFASVGSHGTSLNAIGRTVKDEDVVATWRSLSGLIEIVFGRTLLSKGLLLSHYVRTVFVRNLKAVVTSTGIARNRK